MYFWSVEIFLADIEVQTFFRKLTKFQTKFRNFYLFFPKINFSCNIEFSKRSVCQKTTGLRALKRADFEQSYKKFECDNIVSRKPYRVLSKTWVFERWPCFEISNRNYFEKIDFFFLFSKNTTWSVQRSTLKKLRCLDFDRVKLSVKGKSND